MLFVGAFVALFLILFVVLAGTLPFVPRILAALANRTASFRYHDYLPVVALLALGALVTALAGDQFLDLAELVQGRSPKLQEIDAGVHAWARETRTPGATAFFTLMTIIGTPIVLAVFVAIAAIPLAIKRRWRWLGYLVVTSFGGGLLNLQLKSFFARARPELAEALREAHGYAFPSGHAMGSTVVFGALSYLAFRIAWTWRRRAAAIALAITLITSIAASRVYLGVHWISDIAAGVVAGTMWVVAATISYETSRRIRMIRSLRRRAKGA